MAEHSRPWGFILRVTVSIAALAALAYGLRGKFDEAFLVIRHGLQWGWFALAVAVYLLAVFIISWRLQLVFAVQAVRVTFWQSSYLSFIGLFFTLFFPSSLGGDVAKGYFAYQYSGKKLGSLTGVVLDRLLGFATIIMIALIAAAFYSKSMLNPVIQRSVYGGLALLIFGVFFFANHGFAKKFQFLAFLIPSAKWRQHLSELYHAIRHYQNHKGTLISCLGISFLAQFLFFWDCYLIARSLGIQISLWPFFVLMPLVAFMSMAPSISGLGVREAGFVFFFKALIPIEQAFAFTLLYDFIFYGTAVLAGLLFAFKGGLRKKVIHDLAAAETLREVGHDE